MQRTAARLGRGSYWTCLLVAISLGQGHRQQLCFQSGFTRMGVVLVDAAHLWGNHGVGSKAEGTATAWAAHVLPNEMSPALLLLSTITLMGSNLVLIFSFTHQAAVSLATSARVQRDLDQVSPSGTLCVLVVLVCLQYTNCSSHTRLPVRV
jgi:hypothetical protein